VIARPEPYSLAPFAGALDGLVARTAAGAAGPHEMQAVAEEARALFAQMAMAPLGDWSGMDAWGAQFDGTRTVVSGPRAMLVASGGLLGTPDTITVETGGGSWEMDYEPAAVRVRVSDMAGRSLGFYTFSATGEVTDEDDWNAKIANASKTAMESAGGTAESGGGLSGTDMLKIAGGAAALGAAGLLAAKALKKKQAQAPPAPTPPPPPPPVEKQWHYSTGGTTHGPVAESELKKRLAGLPADVLVWNAGLSGWISPREAGLMAAARTVEATVVMPVMKPAAFELAVTIGPGQMRGYPVAGRVSLGRAADCGVVLNDAAVSRLHAYIEERADGFWLWDNQSANGTWVNGARLSGAVKLKEGDRIQMGGAALVFRAR
jgi:hypothetical protein